MMSAESSRRYTEGALLEYATAVLEAAGLETDKAGAVARSLVGADLLGHATHGLALLPWYLQAIDKGGLATHGDVEVLRERGGCLSWNGRRLPGAWLIEKGIEAILSRIAEQGVVTLSIAQSFHTGALATYLPSLTERGLLVILSSSGPAASGVAPYGGTRGVFTPNPLAAGIPTTGDPILLDTSCSITTINRARQLHLAGERFPQPWLMDRDGVPSNDPAVLLEEGGTLLPVGGLDHGHKGYATSLLVEALTQGLSGYGRRLQPQGTVVNIFLQVIDPEAFGGQEAFEAESSWLADACRNNPPRPGIERVRVPGEQGLARQRAYREHGVELKDQVVRALADCGARFAIHPPATF